ncbi:hypothetical protein [Nocardioides sp.]|uniref:hypothetical protein n=1 Tax=Nocardioides sp. TaxID=35761 RepID=UPI002C89A15D|nr:hypothetical protein [Nocardioides sp.]HSX65939.1 hypothetical protein [Nocardioides sp.]
MSNASNNDPQIAKNAPYRSSRRAVQQGRARTNRPRRRIVVHSELREQPDVRKIARAIISMAMAEAEREAAAQAESAPERTQNQESTDA